MRNILNVSDREAFVRFMRLCAGRCGQILNLSSLGSNCGITHTTARRCFSLLEASSITVLLRPHQKNFGKHIIKSPKLYFIDTGLMCCLLQVGTPDEITYRAERGAIFESFVLSELYKNLVHGGEQPRPCSWREINVIVDMRKDIAPVEIKPAQTIASDFFDNLKYWLNLSGNPKGPAALIYGGDETFKRSIRCLRISLVGLIILEFSKLASHVTVS